MNKNLLQKLLSADNKRPEYKAVFHLQEEILNITALIHTSLLPTPCTVLTYMWITHRPSSIIHPVYYLGQTLEPNQAPPPKARRAAIADV